MHEKQFGRLRDNSRVWRLGGPDRPSLLEPLGQVMAGTLVSFIGDLSRGVDLEVVAGEFEGAWTFGGDGKVRRISPLELLAMVIDE